MKITLPQSVLDENAREEADTMKIIETTERVVEQLEGMTVKMAERVLNRARVEVDARATIKG